MVLDVVGCRLEVWTEKHCGLEVWRVVEEVETV